MFVPLKVSLFQHCDITFFVIFRSQFYEKNKIHNQKMLLRWLLSNIKNLNGWGPPWFAPAKSHNEQIRKPEKKKVCLRRCDLRVNLRCTIKVYQRFFSKLHLDKMIQSVHIGIALAIFGLSITLAQIRPGQLDHFLPPPPSRLNPISEGQRQVQPRQRRPPLTPVTDLLSR